MPDTCLAESRADAKSSAVLRCTEDVWQQVEKSIGYPRLKKKKSKNVVFYFMMLTNVITCVEEWCIELESSLSYEAHACKKGSIGETVDGPKMCKLIETVCVP